MGQGSIFAAIPQMDLHCNGLGPLVCEGASDAKTECQAGHAPILTDVVGSSSGSQLGQVQVRMETRT